MLNVTQIDARRVNELVKTMSRMKIEVEGAEESLALAQVISWVGELAKKIAADWNDQVSAEHVKIAKALSLLEKNAVETPKKKK